jgi:hypothetical protein
MYFARELNKQDILFVNNKKNVTLNLKQKVMDPVLRSAVCSPEVTAFDVLDNSSTTVGHLANEYLIQMHRRTLRLGHRWSGLRATNKQRRDVPSFVTSGVARKGHVRKC